MKKQILTGIAAAFAMINVSSVNAQYFQRGFNFNMALVNDKPEVFYDGLCSRNNFTLNDATKYFNVGVGFTNASSGPAAGGIDELRFVKTSKSGSVSQNFGYQLANSGTVVWYNSQAHAVCEINNGLGTGGFMVVGMVSNNTTTGSAVNGGSDALITKITNSGSMSQKFRFNFGNGRDELNCVIASKVEPGMFYACGTSSFTTHSKVIVIKFDVNINVVWARTYHLDNFSPATLTNYCEAYGIAQSTVDSDLVIVGKYYEPGSATVVDGLYLKINESGSLSSAQKHHLANDDQYRAVRYSEFGDYYYLCGFSNYGVAGINDKDMWLVKLNTGGFIFSKTLRQPGNISFGLDVIERKNSAGQSEYFITGSRYNGNAFNSMYKTDAMGNGINCYAYDTLYPYNYHFMGIDMASPAMTSQGIRIFSNTFTNGVRSDSYLLKTYFNGATCTDDCLFDPPFTLMATISTGVLEYKVDTTFSKKNLDAIRANFNSALICSQAAVACGSDLRSFGDDAYTSKPEELSGLTVYPNYASDFITLRFDYDEVSGNIEVINTVGMVVLKQVINTEGSFETNLNIATLEPGTYFMRFDSGKETKSAKFVKF